MLRSFPTFLFRVCHSVDALRRSLILLVVVVMVPLACAAAKTAKRLYEVAAGDAATTLKQFAEQSGQQVVYVVPKVRGVRTNPVKGEFTAREAIDRMVAKTSLVVVQDEKTGALMINRAASPEPLPDPPHTESGPQSPNRDTQGP